jgi:AraC-like DNA-binding protein
MKFFKETMGTGFTAYLIDYRLEIAAEMLLESSDNILEIALRTGFESLSYFNRSFKKKYGVTPGKYRK